jgi:hypothetical protein
VRLEALRLTVDVLQQLGVVLPKSCRLIRNHLEPVGHLGELSIDRPLVCLGGDQILL